MGSPGPFFQSRGRGKLACADWRAPVRAPSGIPAPWRLAFETGPFFVLRAPTSHHAGRRCLVAPEPQGTIELLLIVSGMTALGCRVNGVPLLWGGLLCSCARTARSLRHCAAEINVNRTAAQEPRSPRDRHVHDGASWGPACATQGTTGLSPATGRGLRRRQQS